MCIFFLLPEQLWNYGYFTPLTTVIKFFNYLVKWITCSSNLQTNFKEFSKTIQRTGKLLNQVRLMLLYYKYWVITLSTIKTDIMYKHIIILYLCYIHFEIFNSTAIPLNTVWYQSQSLQQKKTTFTVNPKPIFSLIDIHLTLQGVQCNFKVISCRSV